MRVGSFSALAVLLCAGPLGGCDLESAAPVEPAAMPAPPLTGTDDPPRRVHNLDPVVNPLDRPGERAIKLPASVVDTAAYDQQREDLFEAYRTSLRLEYVLVAQKIYISSSCNMHGNSIATAFDAATDMFVAACSYFQADAKGKKALYFHNVPAGVIAPEIHFPVAGVYFSHDGKKLLVCESGGAVGYTAHIADLASGVLTALPDVADPLCAATKVQWVDEWRVAFSGSGGSGLRWIDLKTLTITTEREGSQGQFKPPTPPPPPAFVLWKRHYADADMFARLGVNEIDTFVFDSDYGNYRTAISPSARWIASRHGGKVELIHLKSLGDYGGPVPSITFKISSEDAELFLNHEGEAGWELQVRKELRNPLVADEIVGADLKSDLGAFRLIGCGSDLVCDAIPLRPSEPATLAYGRFSGPAEGLVVTNLRPGKKVESPTPFTSDRFWIVETGRLR